MIPALRVLSAGPACLIQDFGRPGYLGLGLSRGGAMDRLALAEGAALLGQALDKAALEMAGMGGRFEALADLGLALTGAPMRATLDGRPLPWPSSFAMQTGAILEIGPCLSGSFGYLHIAGGIAAPLEMGARSAHLTAGIGAALTKGCVLHAEKTGPVEAKTLDPDDRFAGGILCILPTAQTKNFPPELRARLAATEFTRDPRSNRMALRLAHDGDGFALPGGLSVLSEITQPGDIQITGDGSAVLLMAEAQTTGGYPRIATILPADLARAAQTPPGGKLRFAWIETPEALEIERRAAEAIRALPSRARPLIRDPRQIGNLLDYRLIDGMITGQEADTKPAQNQGD
ncbi:MAG: biotin-dependent carboxyltransferase family protein [Pseudomonadota bacterium]